MDIYPSHGQPGHDTCLQCEEMARGAIVANITTATDAARVLDGLSLDDERSAEVEQLHLLADAVLLEFVPAEVRTAYQAARERLSFEYAF